MLLSLFSKNKYIFLLIPAITVHLCYKFFETNENYMNFGDEYEDETPLETCKREKEELREKGNETIREKNETIHDLKKQMNEYENTDEMTKDTDDIPSNEEPDEVGEDTGIPSNLAQ